jgi:large subunit ribosomal protein L9
MQNIKSKGRWKVILTHGVRKLGKRGDVVEVAHGYFRNYLFPQNLAISYKEEKLNEIRSTLKTAFDAKHNQEAINQKKILESKVLYFGRQASGTDVLFGSVTTKDISNEIKSRFNIDILYKKIFINDSIKKTGIYPFIIDLTEDVAVEMNLSVARSVEDAEKMVSELKKHGHQDEPNSIKQEPIHNEKREKTNNKATMGVSNE